MPSKRKRRSRPMVEDVTPTEWWWLTGEGSEVNEFELDDLEHPLHRRHVERCMELLRAYPDHAARNHPGRLGELERQLAEVERRESYRRALAEGKVAPL